jgi:CspA family cold shock protein
MTGIIKRLARDLNFGFVRADGGAEYFFRRSTTLADWSTLKEGDRVTFEQESSPKGPQATKVSRLGSV